MRLNVCVFRKDFHFGGFTQSLSSFAQKLLVGNTIHSNGYAMYGVKFKCAKISGKLQSGVSLLCPPIKLKKLRILSKC